jgi:hypothetical protein
MYQALHRGQFSWVVEFQPGGAFITGRDRFHWRAVVPTQDLGDFPRLPIDDASLSRHGYVRAELYVKSSVFVLPTTWLTTSPDLAAQFRVAQAGVSSAIQLIGRYDGDGKRL